MQLVETARVLKNGEVNLDGFVMRGKFSKALMESRAGPIPNADSDPG
jgi:hypothetical protein